MGRKKEKVEICRGKRKCLIEVKKKLLENLKKQLRAGLGVMDLTRLITSCYIMTNN